MTVQTVTVSVDGDSKSVQINRVAPPALIWDGILAPQPLAAPVINPLIHGFNQWHFQQGVYAPALPQAPMAIYPASKLPAGIPPPLSGRDVIRYSTLEGDQNATATSPPYQATHQGWCATSNNGGPAIGNPSGLQDFWYAWEIMFDPSFPLLAGNPFFQFHEIFQSGSPPFWMGVAAKGTCNPVLAQQSLIMVAQETPGLIPWAMPFQAGVWFELAVHYVCSTDPTAGYVELVVNGVQQQLNRSTKWHTSPDGTKVFFATLSSSLPHSWYLNQYRAAGIKDTAGSVVQQLVTWQTAPRFGGSLAAVTA